MGEGRDLGLMVPHQPLWPGKSDILKSAAENAVHLWRRYVHLLGERGASSLARTA
jgi:hypothetical protein